MTNGNDDGIDIHSSEAGSITQRPKLTVELTYPLLNKPPIVTTRLTAHTLTVNEGDEVQLVMAASDPNDKDPLIFMLEGQDIGYATGSGSVDHYLLFEDEGTYRFSGSVKDDEATVDAGEVTITVNNLPPVIVALTEDQTASVGQQVAFAVEASDPGALDILAIDWDTNGDGVFEMNGLQGSAIFSQAGSYDISVRIRDDDGAEVIEKFTVTVN